MSVDQPKPTVASFGPCQADFQTQEIRKHGVRLRLPGQSFQILRMLLERPGELVTREKLREELWPSDTFVDFDHGLNAAVTGNGHKRRSPKHAYRCGVLGHKGARRKLLAT
jgi:DNA-binding response OmpR family regulator